MKTPNSNPNPWKAAGLVSAMGLDIAACTLFGYWIGRYFHLHFGWSKNWILGGVFTGFFIGIATVIILLKKFLEDSNE
ncbi:AtpZ/AtpI family protein [Paenibacillus larvae]|uniref:Uncharacterized protein n=3 Tax=Paenibacillus larvae TaxID=1464 RepID=V9W1E5_9BACL|nr:AtpZ/AtpI family protein [Paenibacillus larvae]AHD03923.1 hypothetical protein ERIC2_c00440 [Paenibacillus larvae subsp. larvae DSM 25430]ARF68416.1 hypothetical protein B7C51_12270 [Paenibacillus larvae subsp. pulvifaciens]AVF20060.1 Putative F0F1-ATPase subunit [Paenibacillus larvae subsp. larvae]ETK29150.1 hypothetical protein ERIC1_1c26550 [Paenibacillus larvae subsp. larvae DSM 25719]MCY7475712.1 AtpZ/AtpI family protein [Paenibacillus larvae]